MPHEKIKRIKFLLLSILISSIKIKYYILEPKCTHEYTHKWLLLCLFSFRAHFLIYKNFIIKVYYIIVYIMIFFWEIYMKVILSITNIKNISLWRKKKKIIIKKSGKVGNLIYKKMIDSLHPSITKAFYCEAFIMYMYNFTVRRSH